MKLLNKTGIYYILFALPLCAICSLLIYLFISAGIKDELDESLQKEAASIELKLGRGVDPRDLETVETSIRTEFQQKLPIVFSDTSLLDKAEDGMVPYRVLSSVAKTKKQNYLVTIRRSYVETDDLVFSILMPVILLFVVLLAGIYFINYRVSKKLWAPFYSSVEKLKSFRLEDRFPVSFDRSTIQEFAILNSSLNEMTKQMQEAYLKQKEFTENASHELQTPLAIILGKIEVLIQSSKLGSDEMELISGIYNSASRLSHLNKTLLLLAKIENRQFVENTKIDLKTVIEKSISLYQPFADHRAIRISGELPDHVELVMNGMLAETLFNNLMINAIRHNIDNGDVKMELQAHQFIISNTGKPLTIPSAQLFERFSKDSAAADSTGLGLSIVKSVCALYAVTIEHQYHDGRHFFILHF